MDATNKLPPGKTCNDCVHYVRCTMVLGLKVDVNTECDWIPSKFRERPPIHPVKDSEVTA
jgi:hypothetical protein